MPLPPENPENFDKVNYVIDAWARPCEAPWYIYIETLKPAALEAFIVLISFGWADVIRGRFRPKGLGRRSSKRKGKWARRLPAFPEIGNTLGKAIPIGEQLEDFVKWGAKTRFLWRIDNAMQAGLFMWLVADVAEDFVFNWTSLLYKTYWCQATDFGRFSWSTPGYRVLRGGDWHRVEYETKDYQYSPPAWFSTKGATGSKPCTVGAGITVRKIPSFPEPTGVQVRVQNDFTNEMIFQSENYEKEPGIDLTIPLMGVVPPHTSFRVQVFMTGSPWALYGAGAVFAIEVED